MKNYYQILNIKPNATDEEIKRSYRVLAKKYHPDVNPGDSSAANRFAEVNEAHDVLSDPQKRKEYDAKLKEANAPKPRPEDIIARQRATAQAAARQAMRNGFAGGSGSMDPSSYVQRAAQAQAAAHAAAQAQAQNMQAQMTAIKNNAFKAGHDQGVNEARAAANKEIQKLNSDIRTLRLENNKLKNELSDIERDRSELEQELFNRDRELTFEKSRILTLESKLRASASRVEIGHSDAEFEEMRETIASLRAEIKQYELDKQQYDLRNQAQIDLQQDKRRNMQAQIDELNAQVESLNRELEDARAELDQWREYAKTEDFMDDTARKLEEWAMKEKADKKFAKGTLYGPLGVLAWATDEEIKQAYDKLVKRYSAKADDPAYAEKLEAVEKSYAELSDPERRAEYNASIGIDEERVQKERAMREDMAELENKYREQVESQEFWQQFDELTFNAQTGDADAQNRLGEMYYFGDEIEQDFDQAAYWFKEAAKQRHADAMYNLGVCFIKGEGVERDDVTGLRFIKQAAKFGSKAAQEFDLK